MAFDANDLSPHEHFVVDRTAQGEIADFTPMIGPGGAKPSVRAGFLRRLMLGLDPAWTIRAPGVRLKSVRIEGALDLTDCSGVGLPALTLEACDIPDPIDLSHARIARVSLKDCRLTRLAAGQTEIDGELDLRGAGPLGAAGRDTFTANLRGARIDGDLVAHGAKFARATESNDDAIALQGAEIAGNLMLDGGFEAFGCVRLAGARIGGTLSCEGAQVLSRSDAGDTQALDAEGASAGAMMLGGFKAEGEVRCAGARIAGVFDVSGASLRNDFGIALNLANAEIGGELRAGSAKLAGQLVLQGAGVARNLDLRGAEITHRTTPRGDVYGRALDGAALRVGGAALLQGANIKGEVFLADARIEGYARVRRWALHQWRRMGHSRAEHPRRRQSRFEDRRKRLRPARTEDRDRRRRQVRARGD